MAERMTRGQRKFSGAKKKIAEKMAKNALMGGQRIPQYITTKNQRGQRIRKLNPEYKAIYGSANLKNRPLKIDNKGLTPNVKKKAPVKKKSDGDAISNRKSMRELMLKKKTGSTYDPTKANRAGQKMGQRKAGGMIKKMAYGGKVKKMAQGGTAGVDYDRTKPSGGDKSLINEGMFSKLKRKIKDITSSTPARMKGPGEAYDRLTKKRNEISQLLRGPGLTAAERKELRTELKAKTTAQFGSKKDKIRGVYDQFDKQKREDLASKRKADARIRAKEKLKELKGKKAGGSVKKMKGGGMAMKYKHGGKASKKSKKCPRDGIAMRGKTRA